MLDKGSSSDALAEEVQEDPPKKTRLLYVLDILIFKLCLQC